MSVWLVCLRVVRLPTGDSRDIEDKEEIVSSVGQSAVICPSDVNLCRRRLLRTFTSDVRFNLPIPLNRPALKEDLQHHRGPAKTDKPAEYPNESLLFQSFPAKILAGHS